MESKELCGLLKRSFPFWEKLSDAERTLLCENTTCHTYRQGDIIHGLFGRCTGPILIRQGNVRAYMLSDEGREITLYRLQAGDFCMLSASCIFDAITFDVMVEAEDDTEVCITAPRVFGELCAHNLYVENYMLKVAAARFSDVMWSFQEILFKSFDRRLAAFLIEVLDKEGGDTVNLTQEQIARYLGSAREVVSRMLKYFAGEGLLSVQRGGVRVLDLARLRAIAR